MFATPERDWESWDYIVGNIHEDMSISTDRYFHLLDLNILDKDSLQLSFRDPENNTWSKWNSFYGTEYEKTNSAYDIHRSLIYNEIVAESDYPTYEENYEATKILGRIIESKGFTPHYYFSGNKSIHVHIYFDFRSLLEIDEFLQRKIMQTFKYKYLFFRKFMLYLRRKIVSCWDTNVKKFDMELTKGKHLIRSELSRNKQGFKSFTGYSYKDCSFIPYICNENNKIYPKLGEIKLSNPNCTQDLVEEFLDSLDKEMRKLQVLKREASLLQWMQKDEKLPGCVEYMLSDDFKQVGDGYKRAMFILCNELKKQLGEDQALVQVLNWNERMGGAVREQEIKYRIQEQKDYRLNCKYFHEFLREIGVDSIDEKCNRKI